MTHPLNGIRPESNRVAVVLYLCLTQPQRIEVDYSCRGSPCPPRMQSLARELNSAFPGYEPGRGTGHRQESCLTRVCRFAVR